MVLCLPLITYQAASKRVAFAPLTDAQVGACAEKAERYLDMAFRTDTCSQPPPAYRRLREKPRYEAYQAGKSGGELLEFRTTANALSLRRDGSLAWLASEPAFLPPVEGRVKKDEARQFALDYYDALGGRGVPTIESSAPLSPDRYAPSRYTDFAGMTPHCFDLVSSISGLQVVGSTWHMEIDPAGGRLVVVSTSSPVTQVEGPLASLITPEQADSAAAAAMRRATGAPGRFRVVHGQYSSPKIEVLRFHSGWLTELTPHHQEVLGRRIAIPAYRPQVQQLPGTYHRGQNWPVFWDTVIDARTGRCLAISWRNDPLQDSLAAGERPQTQALPVFPILVRGIFKGTKTTPVEGQIRASKEVFGKASQSIMLKTDEGYRIVFFDSKNDLIRVEGAVGRPDARLLRMIRSLTVIPLKSFGKS